MVQRSRLGGRTGPWFQVGELVLFALQQDIDKLRKNTNISHMDTAHNMDLVHTWDAQEDIANGTYNRIKEATSIGVIASFASILSKGGIARSQKDEGISQTGNITLADVLTMKKEGVPLTEHVTARHKAVNYGGFGVYQETVYTEPIINPNNPNAGLKTRSGSASSSE